MSIQPKSIIARLMLVLAAGGAYGATAFEYDYPAGASSKTQNSSSISASSPTSAVSSTTTSTTTTTIAVAPYTPAIILTADLAQGAKGDDVLAVQNRLVELGFDPGKLDGSFGLAMRYAVEGFQKFKGMLATGVVNADVAAALAEGLTVTPLVEGGAANRLEIDLTRQVLILYKDGKVRLISTVSTGSGRKYCVNGSCQIARTPTGDFNFMWRYSGWRESRLGKLYNPVYFTAGGIAVHGSNSVPTHPASHGCIRIPMHIASYFPSLVAKGDPVHVVGVAPLGPGGTEYITIKPPVPPEELAPVPEDGMPVDLTTPSTTAVAVVPPSIAPQAGLTGVPTSITPQPPSITAPPTP